MEESRIQYQQNFILKVLLNNEDEEDLREYFNQIYDALATKEDITYLSLSSFEKYLDIPLIICDKLYYYFDTEKQNKLSKENFTNNFLKIYSNNLQTKINFFINFFDFNNTGQVHVENFKIIFYYFHSITNNSPLDQIDQLLQDFYSISFNKTTFPKDELANILQKENSNLFFLFYIYLNMYKPFNKENILYCRNKINKSAINNDIINCISKENKFVNNNNIYPPNEKLVKYVNNEYNFFQSYNIKNIYQNNENKQTHFCKDHYTYNKQNKQVDCFTFNKNFTFYKEHLVFKDQIYPLKNSFIDNEENKIIIYLCNNNSISFELDVKNEEDLTHFIDLYYEYHSLPKINKNYFIKEKIGDGQFGMIKLCVSKKTKESFALKIIDKEDKKINIQWEKDISKLLIKNHSDNVIKCYDVFETKKFLFIVYEYMPMGNLNDFLFNTTILLSSKQIGSILIDVLKGLEFLNKFYIIHRDIKPENILISKNFNFVLTDFGFGKVVPYGEKTDEGFGTPCYVSPEVISKKPYDKATDLWSIGVLAYYLVYGKLPFDDEDSNLNLIKMKILKIDYELYQPDSNEAIENYHFVFSIIKCFLQHDYCRTTLDNFLKELPKA